MYYQKFTLCSVVNSSVEKLKFCFKKNHQILADLDSVKFAAIKTVQFTYILKGTILNSLFNNEVQLQGNFNKVH